MPYLRQNLLFICNLSEKLTEYKFFATLSLRAVVGEAIPPEIASGIPSQ